MSRLWPQNNVQLGAILSALLGVGAAVAEYLHPGAGFFPCGVAAGVWLSSAWLWVTGAC